MLDAATRVFATRGFHSASMDEIAAAVGVTKPLVYSYFGSKEGLLAACVARVNEELRDEFTRTLEPIKDPELRMWTGIRTLFNWIDGNREGWRLFMQATGAGVTPLLEEVNRARRDMVATIRGLMGESAAALGIGGNLGVEIEAMSEAFVAANVAIANRWLAHHPEESADHQALRVMNFVWLGLGGMAERRLWVPPAP
jgi:AcrR family transcriptional regulator